MIRSEILTLTPHIAADLMSKNVSNRPVSKSTVDRYVRAIKNGEWALNGEPLIIFSNGTLGDGQHRCLAVMASGIAIQTVVIYGISDATFSTLNAGKLRNSADVLAIKGEINTNPLAAAARAYLLATLAASEGKSVSVGQITQCVDAHPHLRYWVKRYAGTKNAKLMPSSFCGLLTVASEKYGIEKLDSLFEKVAHGEGLIKGDPALVLREKFMMKTGSRMQQGHARAYMIKGINAHIMGKSIPFLRYTIDEPMPTIF